MAIRSAEDLRVKVFGDGADLASMLELARNPLIKGFTTNPTLMRKAGVQDYRAFAREVLGAIHDRPISFEVLADVPELIRNQALEIAGWADNVYVKVPISLTDGTPLLDTIAGLSHQGVKVNVTAAFTLEQVVSACRALRGGAPSVVSVFAGRIADAGRDPVPHMQAALGICRAVGGRGVELLWASPREVLNVVQADAVGVDIITATGDVLAKLPLIGKDLEAFSRETVAMFVSDARKAGYTL